VERDLQALLDHAARLAGDAAAAIMAVRARGCAVETKPDDTPVTEADRAAEAIIAAGLRAATPEIAVIAEEEVAAGRVVSPGALFWLVDPLDGTREFAAGRDEFAVNIGLVRDGAPLLGAVALPATGELFSGIVGRGAWKGTGAGRRPISARAMPAEGPVVLGSRHYADDPRIAAFAAAHRAQRLVNLGSAVKFCRVAEGGADLYPRFGVTMEWDTAAPQAIVEAAGGSVQGIDGAPLRYGKPGWRNPDFVCRGRA
jgi:3'(2'), 5'-bisphosphate nucleotidase